jgi:hypothetical protein
MAKPPPKVTRHGKFGIKIHAPDAPRMTLKKRLVGTNGGVREPDPNAQTGPQKPR